MSLEVLELLLPPSDQHRALSTTKAHGTNTINNINGATAGDIRVEISKTGNCKAAANWNIFTMSAFWKRSFISEAESEASNGAYNSPPLCLLLWDCHFCLTAGQKEFLRAIFSPSPQTTAILILGQRTYSDGTGKMVSVGMLWVTVWGVWEGNSASSLIQCQDTCCSGFSSHGRYCKSHQQSPTFLCPTAPPGKGPASLLLCAAPQLGHPVLHHLVSSGARAACSGLLSLSQQAPPTKS